MQASKECCSSIGTNLNTCFSNIGTGINTGCSAIGRGLSSAYGSITTSLSSFYTETALPGLEKIASAVSGFFTGAWTYIKSDSLRVKHFSVGILAGVVTLVLAVLCYKKCCGKVEEKQ